MTKDRLADLKIRYTAVNGGANHGDGESSVLFLDDFLHKIEISGQSVDEIEKLVEQIKAVQLRILSSPNVDKDNSSQLDELMRRVKTLSTKTRTEVKALEDELHSDSLLKNSGLERIKVHQHSALLKRFLAAMWKYNENQLAYRSKCKSRIQLQLQIAGTFVSDEQVEEMLESSNPCVFTEAVMQQTESAKQSLREIEARHTDIVKLERSIEEMREMFAYLALLVDQQGDLIDNVERCVGNAIDSVEASKKKVASAVVKQRKYKKMKIICIIVGVLLLLLIIIALAGILGLR